MIINGKIKTSMPHKVFYRRVRCQYCKELSTVVEGIKLYGVGHKLSDKEFYFCNGCDAWVGMHHDTKKPFGTLAKSDLRKKRVLAHAEFDKLWNLKIQEGYSKTAARKYAYQWLAECMNKPVDKCHIGFFNIDECNKVISLCKKNKA